jgi:rhamnosyltransferase
MIRYSIVIRTLNEARYLSQLLSGIREQNLPADQVEVLVVDSGSTDGTLEIAEDAGCRILHLTREEFSFGRSLNIGCEAATGDFLIFISGHCVPVSGSWLPSLVLPFQDQSVAISYGRQEGGPETKFSEHSLFRKYFPPCSGHGQSPFFCNNANLAVRRELWAEHRFDESLTGLEDMYLAKQLWLKKWQIVYVPEASVYHYHHERWAQIKRRYEREAIALKEILPEVHIHWYDALRYFAAGVLGDWAAALQQKRLLKTCGETIAFRFCQFYGAWRGNHSHRYLSRQEKERYFYPG